MKSLLFAVFLLLSVFTLQAQQENKLENFPDTIYCRPLVSQKPIPAASLTHYKIVDTLSAPLCYIIEVNDYEYALALQTKKGWKFIDLAAQGKVRLSAVKRQQFNIGSDELILTVDFIDEQFHQSGGRREEQSTLLIYDLDNEALMFSYPVFEKSTNSTVEYKDAKGNPLDLLELEERYVDDTAFAAQLDAQYGGYNEYIRTFAVVKDNSGTQYSCESCNLSKDAIMLSYVHSTEGIAQEKRFTANYRWDGSKWVLKPAP